MTVFITKSTTKQATGKIEKYWIQDHWVISRSFIKTRAPDKVHIFISITPISSPNPMFDHLLESSHRDDSNNWSNVGFG